MQRALPLLLTFNGGYVDVAGFLALQGLFTAHVTGNFATLAAASALGTSGILTKMLAVPAFCLFVLLDRLADNVLRRRGWPVVRTLLAVQMLLLGLGGFLAVRLGPFADGDAWPALLTGMTLVAAMSLQNALHRSHLADSPPSTVMTSTITQLMLDLADLAWGLPAKERARLVQIVIQVAIFALGCGAAAVLSIKLGVWCFALPPLVVVAALAAAGRWDMEPDQSATAR